MALESLDLYEVEQLYTDEERMVRDTVRAWVRERVLPRIEGWAWEGRFPQELVPEMAELGLFGATFAELRPARPFERGVRPRDAGAGAGGLGAPLVRVGAVGSGHVPDPHVGLAGAEGPLDPAPREGRAIGCFGLTEPDFGSNPGAMRTRARRDGDSWVLSGEKAWITNGSIADVAVVWAKDDDGIVRGFLVERGHAGLFDRRAQGEVLAAGLGDVRARARRLPRPGVEPPAGRVGPQGPPRMPDPGPLRDRVGRARLCARHLPCRAATTPGPARSSAARPSPATRSSRRSWSWMANEITKGQLMVWRLGRLKDEGKATPVQVSQAKRNTCWVARECARLSREILGANGIVNEYPVMRHLMNIESVYTYEGTHDMHTLVLGEHLTGIPAFMPPREEG